MRAEDVAQIPCWPDVVKLSDSTPLCSRSGCIDGCSMQPVESCTCARIPGRPLDLAHSCRAAERPIACGFDTTQALLTCYVDDSGTVFSSDAPFLVELGNTKLRHCTPAEGGTLAPKMLPPCP